MRGSAWRGVTLSMQDQEHNTSRVSPKSASGVHATSLVLLLLLIAIITAVILTGNMASWVEWLQSTPQAIREMGWMGQLAIIGLMILHCFVPFPAEFVAVTAGSIYGPILGTVLTWSGAMIGALISFGLTRLLGQPFISWVLPEKQKNLLDQWTHDQGAITLLVSRFIPVIAFNLINVAAGLTRISWWTFIWTTGIGILPLTALMVYMGSQMKELSWPMLLLVSAACIALMAILHWVMRRKVKTR